MKTESMPLSELREGQTASVLKIELTPSMYRRMQDLGMVRGTCVRCERIAPAGSPTVYCIRGAMVALRRCDAEKILVERRI